MRANPHDVRDSAPLVSPKPGSEEERDALERIDELRELEQAGLAPDHPDQGPDFVGPFQRAAASRETRSRRRAELRRYWRKHARP